MNNSEKVVVLIQYEDIFCRENNSRKEPCKNIELFGILKTGALKNQ